MTHPVEVRPGTIAIYADLACPWAHLCVHRLHVTRSRMNLHDAVAFDIRTFALEVVNKRATPKRNLDAEIPVAGGLDPSAGWQMWEGETYDYAVTTLPAMEAVQIAKEQGLRASETLDRALRLAFFERSRNISMRHEILAVAAECDGVDETALQEALDEGRARRAVLQQHAEAQAAGVEGSPHLFLRNGRHVFNPGVHIHWEGRSRYGFPVVDKDDPTIYEELLLQAA